MTSALGIAVVGGFLGLSISVIGAMVAALA